MLPKRQLTLSPTSIITDLPGIDTDSQSDFHPQFSQQYNQYQRHDPSNSSSAFASTSSAPFAGYRQHSPPPYSPSRKSGKRSLSLPRFNAPSPITPISYPYSAASLGLSIRSTLRPRRRASLIRLAQRRLLHFFLAFSLPILIFLLVNEHTIHHHRTSFSPLHGPLHPSAKVPALSELRAQYEKKRRREILDARRPQQSKRTLLSTDRGASSAVSLEDVTWTPEDELALEKEREDIWPDWWGNVDAVGKSPLDHVPNPIPGGKRRILFLTDYTDYLERMNTHTYEIVDASLRHPNVITDVWGPGWAGYNRSLPLSINIKRRQRRIAQMEQSKADYAKKLSRESAGTDEWWETMVMEGSLADMADTAGDEGAVDKALRYRGWKTPEWDINDEEEGCGELRFDIVWTISDIFKQNDPHIDVLDCGSLLVQQLGDCHSFRCLQEWYPQANNITLSKYAFELPEIFDHRRVKEQFPEWQMGIFGHSPDTGNEWDFYPEPWANKTSVATMFGFDGSFYPIRTTVTDHVRDNPSSSFSRHEHPGYTLSIPEEARQNPLETYTKGHELYRSHEALRADFARGMREAKICVFDASLERKMIRKYAQALLSGCVIAADLPTEHEEALERFTIKLKPTWGIERIKQEVDRYLAQPERLHQMALDGFLYARQHLTTTRKVTDVIRMADAHKAGMRGYDFPHSFSLRCRAYWSDEDAYRPPWCKQHEHRGLEG